ncbi:MAG: 2Fe-2S iron-sulfur cluster binding domain-containing protein [Hydrogenophaga sp.]|uniref:2Fe-2S iron-sulfur cluster binding domain-containing protein n=1 Tax=Hydrogenophaga crocea TaxID=2716225 RepID=A0A6G8IKU2_9BURK|nr:MULTISPECIES: 2Fe-2S iron-sulfur cluster-binding protein [Hydrogenophaga]MBL0943743.1 2Fe-2S iron-sulfur cluster binding domain-containing protein [Hydrogenophaga sp.]QIM53781.1 2Fe-2S iron-sulfur cluster binding domain-containing protein [Hydrogenophaga crocea]
MPKIVFIDHLGTRYETEAPVGRNLMQVALDHGVPGILGDCGGACSCATCHGYIGEPWAAQLPERSATEVFMLEAVVDERPDSRLCCQIKVRPELEGLVVRLPAEQA